MSSRRLVAASALLLAAGVLSACDAGNTADGSPLGGRDAPEGSEGAAPEQPSGTATVNVKRGATGVAVDTVVKVKAQHGRLSQVSVRGAGDAGSLPGAIAGDGSAWKATELLEPGTSYAVKAVVRGEDGELVTRKSGFTTEDLSLDQQTYPSVAPLPGETVGVGMPVIVSFDVPVTDKAAIEKHMTVTTEPAQPGTWHWISDNEAHYRPKTYWKAGSQVSVDVDINGVAAGNGIYGQEDREVDFNVGDAHIYRVDMNTHQMRVLSNGKLLRTIPITTGEQPKFTTRSGVKVIIEKFDSKRMNSETVGIPVDSADGYDIDNVQWAMRVTYSGEFVHAAPWSVGSQGHANVSHGCTGMSTDNAYWLYQMTRRGDVVEYVGSDRQMEPTNGYGDWNVAWSDYRAGSALT
jgi:lipoprotein-anchoring transpeptidase ErfK/SrfK